jgi:hypothetical protein
MREIGEEGLQQGVAGARMLRKSWPQEPRDGEPKKMGEDKRVRYSEGQIRDWLAELGCWKSILVVWELRTESSFFSASKK